MMVRFNRKHAAALCALASVGALFAFLPAGVRDNPKDRPAVSGPAGIARILSGIRIPFQENAGQFPSDVAFGARMFAGSVFVTREGGLVYSLYGRPGGTTPGKARVLRETLVGGKTWEISGEDPSSARISRFAGKDPAKWIRGIRAWDTVRLDQVYRGVDVRLRARGGSIEKIFHVRPGADPSAIHLRVDGADRLAVNDRGELEASVGKETVRFTAPVAWQEDDGGGKTPVVAAYEVAGNEYGFRLAGYDTDREVIIDPLLAATYLGGTVGPVADGFDDQPYAMDFDSSGNLYVAGATGSSNFPSSPGYDSVMDGTTDAYVVKLSSDLTQVLAATFVGGGTDDIATAVRVSGSSVYVAGATNSSDFPATPDPGTTRGSWDVFVVKLNLPLSSLTGTILGGSFIDNEACLALDGSGNVFIAGRTQSPDFPVTAGTYDNTVSGPDIQPDVTDFFIAKIDGSSLSLLAGTYLRGPTGVPNTSEAFPAIAVDGSDNVVLAGLSEATDYPTTAGAYSTTGGGAQVVVSKLNNALTSLLYSTFVGPSALGYRVSLALSGDNVWIGGYASGSSFPVTGGAHRTTYASKEGFVTKLNGTLSSPLLASTYVGGSGDDFVTGIAAATDGSVYATGQTASSDFAATSGAFDNSFNGVLDVFVRRYSGDLASLQYSSFLFLGSTSSNSPRAFLSLDGTGNVYVAGITNYASIPTTAGTVQESFNLPGIYNDGFIAKFNATLSADNTAPTVSSVLPSSGATAVPVDNTVRVTFSERMKTSTIDNTTITVAGVTGTVTYDGVRTATFTPADNLAAGTAYTVTVTTGVQDYWGNAMVSNYTSTFTTAGGSSGSSSSGGGGGGCTVTGGRKMPAEEGWPAALVLLLPPALLAARRLRVRYGARNR
jgi:hypothetical protein